MGSDSKGAGSKAVTYSEFQDYVKKGYVSKVLGYEDKSIEAFLKPTAVGAVFEPTLPKWDATLSLQVETPSTDKLEEFLQAEKEAGHFDGSSDYPPKSDIFPRNSDSGTPACLAGCVMDILHAPYERRRQWWPGGVFNVGKSKAQLFEKAEPSRLHLKM